MSPPNVNDSLWSDEPSPEETEAYQKSLEFVFEVVLLVITGCFGIVGNTAAIFLFSRQEIQVIQKSFQSDY